VALTVGGASTNPTTTYSGVLSDTGSLTKAGSGTFTLTNSNSYTGTTTVAAGTMVVSGSLSGTVSASVSSSATLKVNGSINTAASIDVSGTLTGSGTVGAVNVLTGGAIAPGSGGTGAFTTGAETWANGGSYLWEINTLSANGGIQGSATGWDYLRSTSAGLNFTADNTAKFTLTIDSLGALPGWNNTVSQSWTIASFTGGITGFSADKFILDPSAFADQNPLGGGAFSLSQVGATDLRLDFIAIPEPTAVPSLLGGIVILFASRRLRRLA
jgi:autotransporter-associated beta strand protein